MAEKRLEEITQSANPDVYAYLNQRHDLLDVLPQIREAVTQHFGENHTLRFAIFSDPEERDNPQLLITISTPQSPDEAYERLNHFDHQWWFKQSTLLRQQITIALS